MAVTALFAAGVHAQSSRASSSAIRGNTEINVSTENTTAIYLLVSWTGGGWFIMTYTAMLKKHPGMALQNVNLGRSAKKSET